MRTNDYPITIDQSFREVISACATSGGRQLSGTWIGTEMIAAYEKLFDLGFCHSVEVWKGEELVGGLYGVSIGRCFFGESMFHSRNNTSKIALYALSQTLFMNQFVMIDMQMPTTHLFSLGGRVLDRESYERLLMESIEPLKFPFPEQVCLERS